MSFQAKRRDWKRVQPSSLREAFRLCKDHAVEQRRLSVARIADEMGITEDLLYRYLSDGSMKAREIRIFEGICGARYVTNHLAASGNRVVVEIPSGRAAQALEVNELQAVIAEAIGKLIRFYNGAGRCRGERDRPGAASAGDR